MRSPSGRFLPRTMTLTTKTGRSLSKGPASLQARPLADIQRGCVRETGATGQNSRGGGGCAVLVQVVKLMEHLRSYLPTRVSVPCPSPWHHRRPDAGERIPKMCYCKDKGGITGTELLSLSSKRGLVKSLGCHCSRSTCSLWGWVSPRSCIFFSSHDCLAFA